jgi:hypothetical protein
MKKTPALIMILIVLLLLAVVPIKPITAGANEKNLILKALKMANKCLNYVELNHPEATIPNLSNLVPDIDVTKSTVAWHDEENLAWNIEVMVTSRSIVKILHFDGNQFRYYWEGKVWSYKWVYQTDWIYAPPTPQRTVMYYDPGAFGKPSIPVDIWVNEFPSGLPIENNYYHINVKIINSLGKITLNTNFNIYKTTNLFRLHLRFDRFTSGTNVVLWTVGTWRNWIVIPR